jgi:hypothetical protein
MPEDTVPIAQLRLLTDTADRRAHERISCDLRVSCRPLRSRCKRFQLVGVTDISTRGVGLVVDRHIASGTILVIEIQRQQFAARTLLARVAHTTRSADGVWHVGCEFASRLSQRELRTLLS